MSEQIIVFRDQQVHSIVIKIYGEQKVYSVKKNISVRKFTEYFKDKVGTIDYVEMSYRTVIQDNQQDMKPGVLEMLAKLVKEKKKK